MNINVSTIYSVDGVCVWMSPTFYLNAANAIPNPASTYVDVFGQPMSVPKDYSYERSFIMENYCSNCFTKRGYNKKVSERIIDIFIEDFTISTGGNAHSVGRALLESLKEFISCITYGLFETAIIALADVEETDFLTSSKKTWYINMLQASDASSCTVNFNP